MSDTREQDGRHLAGSRSRRRPRQESRRPRTVRFDLTEAEFAELQQAADRAGLANGDTPEKVERELMRVVPQERWIDFSHQIIHHGRQVCDARKPKCDRCNLEQLCHSEDKTWRS